MRTATETLKFISGGGHTDSQSLGGPDHDADSESFGSDRLRADRLEASGVARRTSGCFLFGLPEWLVEALKHARTAKGIEGRTRRIKLTSVQQLKASLDNSRAEWARQLKELIEDAVQYKANLATVEKEAKDRAEADSEIQRQLDAIRSQLPPVAVS